MSLTPDAQVKYNHAELGFLREVGRELTDDAQKGKIKDFVGREQEIQMMIETLCRETKSNPILVGPAGVGKTALVEGLALRIVRGQVPQKLRDCRLFSVSSSALVAGSNWYGMIETKIKHLLEEAKREKVLIFIDEIHTIVGTAPDQDSTRDIGQQLKPALARGEIKLIGATTDDEYSRFIEIDEALDRRFQPVRVPELGLEQTLGILKEIAKRFSSKHRIEVSENVLRMILAYSERFMRNRHFPDKAIDLLEQSIAFAESQDKKRISSEDARQVVRRMVGMPSNLSETLQNLAEDLTGKAILDEVQTKQFCDFLQVSMQGMSLNPERPNAVVFHLGEAARQTNYLAETIAGNLFSDKNRIIKLNFASLTEKFEFNQMIGIEVGIRRQSPDAAIAKISQIPWCIIVCEGLENASITVQEIWAKAIENGFITNAGNKKIYLSDAVVIMSANIDVCAKHKMGFSSSSTPSEEEQLNIKLEKYFSKSLIKFADFSIFSEKENTPNARRQWLKEKLHNNLSRRFRLQGIYLHWDKSILENLSRQLEELDSEQDWERLINFQILPLLLPFVEQCETRLSLKICFNQDEIVIESTELPEDIENQVKLEESLKRELYEKAEFWLKGLFYVEKNDDFSMMSVYDGKLQVDVYFSIWKEQLLLSFQTRIADNFHSDENLVAYILEKNMNLRFGKFAIESDGAIWLEYSMFGEYCNAKNFLVVLRSMTETARKYKEELKKRDTSVITSQWISDEAAEWLESRRVKKGK